MAENSRSTTAKTARKSETANGAETPFPLNFAQMQARNMAMIARANEILIDTAKAVWEKETELFRLETEQARDSLAPVKNGSSPAAAFSGLCSQWHANSERAIDQIRAINDQVRDCEWKLLELFAGNLAAAPQQEAAE